jgi:hypothetical protein
MSQFSTVCFSSVAFAAPSNESAIFYFARDFPSAEGQRKVEERELEWEGEEWGDQRLEEGGKERYVPITSSYGLLVLNMTRGGAQRVEREELEVMMRFQGCCGGGSNGVGGVVSGS